MKQWWIRLLTALAIVTLSGCAVLEKQVRKPEVSLADVRVTGMSLSSAQLAFDVEVKNPNPLGISLQGLSYALALQEKPLFNGTLQNRLSIGANATSRVTLPFNLRYEDLFGSLTALRDQHELHYTISGEADFGLFRLPYSKSGTLPLPRLPEVSVEGLRINKLGLTGTELALALKVGNSNNFPLRLNGLSYDLKLANASLLQGESTTPLNVAPNGSGRMVRTLRLNYAQLGELLQQLRSAPSLPIELDSRIKLPGSEKEVPYHWKGETPLLR
jgi:LEA14-like dessication related protein